MNKESKNLYYAKKIEEGEKTWREFCDDLPQATGDLRHDEERIKLFAERAKKLPASRLQNLKLFMRIQVDYYTTNGTETYVIKQHCNRWRSVYKSHLEAIC